MNSDSRSEEPRIFDIERVASLIKEELPALNVIDGKDLSLCLGRSGSGKSSLICFLRGNAMTIRTEKRQDAAGNIFESEPWVDSEVSDPKFLIGNKIGEGVTKNISIGSIPGSDLIIGDTSGFMDPQGTIDAGVDIANAFTIQNAMRRSRSVRPVLVCKIDLLNSGRGPQFIQLLFLLARFFSPIEQYFPSLTFFFTGGDPREPLMNLMGSDFVKNDKLGPGVLEKFVNDINQYVRANFASCVILPEHLVSQDPSMVKANRSKYLALIECCNIPLPD
jgi:hypothetical protein